MFPCLMFTTSAQQCKNFSSKNFLNYGIVFTVVYLGGKILARFETPAHRFLFPEVPPAKGELQQIQLNKSRKYQVSWSVN